MPPRIEALLAARLFVAPQIVGDRLFFISNLSGHLSLYVMDTAGSVPEPLLPPHIALQNPDLIGGYPYYVFPRLGMILVMIDRDGDERYRPMLVPLDGGFPEPAFGEMLAGQRVALADVDSRRDMVYLVADNDATRTSIAYQGNLATRTLERMGGSEHGCYVAGVNAENTAAILLDFYTVGDHVLYRWDVPGTERRLLYGRPIDQRHPGEQVPVNAIGACEFTPGDRGLLFQTALFDDTYGLGYLDLQEQDDVRPVTIEGVQHTGVGELTGLEALRENRYLVTYNIDGASWAYEGVFDEVGLRMELGAVLCGTGMLEQGVLESIRYDRAGDRFALSFSTATSPTQLYTIAGAERDQITRHTRERVLGISQDALAAGEDASFTSWDGLRVSARLYLPTDRTAFPGPRPIVYYVHGGPQSQERPDFAWFSMPLIQFLTLRGFAVFVPNVRGSTGYGLAYTKHVDRDWGGADRLDHVHAMRILADDRRVDTARTGVVGRSYGGYMTLTLATRHPDLWKAAVDMFGPYDLLTFIDRVPETWRGYFTRAVGDPQHDREALIERSPRTYVDRLDCPLLVIQGQNDPRVIERESRDVVETMRAVGKQVEYLLFENEGHDVLKFENRVRCYNAIAAFFTQHLRP